MKEHKILKVKMRKKMEGVLSLLLICTVIFSTLFGNVQLVNAQSQNNQTLLDSNNLSVQGTNSFGKLVSNEIEQKLSEQEANNGNNIFEITVEGTVAAVSFETMQNCTVVVGIYDEQGIKMLASGAEEVTPEQTKTQVTIETDAMPEYFIVRGFLVESDTLRPLATAYESPNYTQEMQEFFAKTTDDFEAERVLNLDDDKNNNFAVFAEETKLIEATEGVNTVVSSDDDNGVYVIENADSSITSLAAGEIFAYEYGDTVLIVKVESIDVEGTTATIRGAELSLEEVFEYVKIDNDMSTKEATVDTSTCSEGVTYEGMTEHSTKESKREIVGEEGYESNKKDAEGSITYEHNFPIKEYKKENGDEYEKVELTVNGSLGFSITGKFKIYTNWKYNYIELSIDYEANVKISIEGTGEKKIKLARFGLSPVWGVYIEFTPSIVVKANAELTIKGSYEGTVGISVSNEYGIRNISKAPHFKPEIKIEGTFYIGLSLEPKIKFISEKIAYAKSFIDKLANGINPLDNTPIPTDDLINNVRLSRCFFFVSDILRQVYVNGGIIQPTSAKIPFYITDQQLQKFNYSDIPITISEIANRIYAIAENEYMQKLSYKKIHLWLLNIGMLSLQNSNGTTFKRPTEQGNQLGIIVETREGTRGKYQVVLYNKNAQHFILNNIKNILSL